MGLQVSQVSTRDPTLIAVVDRGFNIKYPFIYSFTHLFTQICTKWGMKNAQDWHGLYIVELTVWKERQTLNKYIRNYLILKLQEHATGLKGTAF